MKAESDRPIKRIFVSFTLAQFAALEKEAHELGVPVAILIRMRALRPFGEQW